MYKLILITVSLAIALAGCAKPPSSIPLAVISSNEYSQLSCSQLAKKLSATSDKLSAAEKKQREKVASDAVTVFLILIPFSAFTGDSSADVARYKGEKQALERSLSSKTC